MRRTRKTLDIPARHKGNVSVDSDGRVFLFGYREVNSVGIEFRFHFYQAELNPEDWARMRKRHRRPKRLRHICFSHGVWKGEGRGAGLWVSPSFQIQRAFPPN